MIFYFLHLVIPFNDQILIEQEQIRSNSNKKLAMIILAVSLLMVVTVVGPGLYMYYKRSQSDDQLEEKPETQPLQPIKESELDKTSEIDLDILIERNDLKIEHKIGQGQFGSVHYGELTLRNGRVDLPVAIKMSSKNYLVRNYKLTFN